VRSLKDILGEDVSLRIDQGHSNARAQTPTQSLAPLVRLALCVIFWAYCSCI
jgi:hypothetical protein